MLTLGIAGLANVSRFLEQHFPEQMAQESRIVQGMDAAAALLQDGKVVAAASQERFDRIKKSGAFPFQAVQYCLDAAGATLDDVEHVCGNFDFGRYRPVYAAEELARRYWSECLAPDAVFDLLRTRFRCCGHTTHFHPIDHHDAHLHAALASSGFDHCLAIVMDAAGELGATSVYRCEGTKITRLARHPIAQSLGMFYSLITQFLGYAFNEDEYKVMGLASFGDPQRHAGFFQNAIQLGPNGSVAIPCLTLNRGFAESLFFTRSAEAIATGLGIDGRTCAHQERADISAGLQHRFTEALFHICDHWQKATQTTNLLLSGGCAENCAAIGELRSSGRFERIHIAFASGDEGTALGAAAAHAFAQGRKLRIPGEMPFLRSGTRSGRTARASSPPMPALALHEFADEAQMLDAAADDIADDRIVALCNGRMEFGARALGNRSLLALPSNPDNKDRINLAIKKRQNYRPFAPAVTAEDAHRYFVLNAGEAYPYMTMLTHVREIGHADPARGDTYRRNRAGADGDPAGQSRLLPCAGSAAGRCTGVPVVLNTSYNVNHQPIVCTETEAVDTFVEMGIDALYIANARITRAAK